jgi:uncharacterized membrane protein
MSATDVPATPPESGPYDPDLKLVIPGKGLAAGAGWDWIVEGWSLFTKAPLMWILSLLVIFVVAVVVSLVPIVGQLAFQLLQGVLAAGFMVACRSLEKGGEFEIEHLATGFSRRFVPLLVVGLIFLLGWVAIFLVFMLFVGVGMVGAFMAGDPENAARAIMASMGSIVLGTLVMLALMVPLVAAYWFAPALVMMHDMKPVAAMKESFFACFRNFVPFLVYGLVMMIGAFIAILPFGLGMLVWIPVAIASTYVAYRQIFTED